MTEYVLTALLIIGIVWVVCFVIGFVIGYRVIR